MTYFILGDISSHAKLLGTARTEKGLSKKVVSIVNSSMAPKKIFVVKGKVVLHTKRCAGES